MTRAAESTEGRETAFFNGSVRLQADVPAG